MNENSTPPKPKGRLTLTCSKCTRYRHFYGTSMMSAGAEAERKGWKRRGDVVICNRCPK